MERIESLTNRNVIRWNRLHEKKGRDEAGRFLVEGDHLITEAMKAGVVETIITDDDADFRFPHTVSVSAAVMKKLSRNVSAVHHMAVCRINEQTIENNHRLLLLDGIQDPGNLGTLIRTAVSFSFDGIYLSPDCCDVYNEKTIRSTQGALFTIPFVRTDLEDAVSRLQDAGVTVYATALDASIPFGEVQEGSQMAFILGNEGQGVHPRLQKLADQRIRIEMQGFESLNVAVAGGIVMYRFRAQ